MRLIGLTGYAGSGKDTVAGMISDQLPLCEVQHLAFAAPLKRFCREVFDWTEQHTDGPLKEVPDKRWQRPDGSYLTPRYAMQRLGTEWGRDCDLDVWVKLALRTVETLEHVGADVAVITDVRFVNEARAVREAGGEVWRVQRGAPRLTHASERDIWSTAMDLQVSIDIDNRGTLLETATAVAAALRAKAGWAP